MCWFQEVWVKQGLMHCIISKLDGFQLDVEVILYSFSEGEPCTTIDSGVRGESGNHACLWYRR